MLEPPRAHLEALVAAFSAGDTAAAEAMAGDLTRQFPAHGFAWKVLGAIYQRQGRLAESLNAKQRCVALEPDDAAAHANLAVTLNHLGRFEDAVASARQALRLNADFPQAHNTLGAALKALGDLDAAEEAFRAAIRLNPAYADAHNNLGSAIQAAGRPAEAEAHYREAARLRPDDAQAFNNLGVALFEQGRLSEAERAYREATRLDPDHAEACNNLGVTLTDLGRLAEAEASYRAALKIRPDYAEAHSNLLFGLNYVAALPPEAALAEAERYGARVSQAVAPKFTKWRAPDHPGRLRVGLVSGDLRNHPVGYFVEGLIRHLDPEQFELVAFPTAVGEDDLTARLKPRFATWTSLSGKTDASAAAAIRDHGVQVLIDLSGHTAHNRLPVFGYRPAPVQASWLGYFATTGLPEMDFFLGDPHMSPAGEHHHFTERVWPLADTWLCLTPPEPPIAVTPSPAAAAGAVTFGNLGNLAKVNDAVVDAWAAILRRAPGSRLLLKSAQFADPDIVAKIQGWFAARGVSADRLILERHGSRSEYFETYGRIDIVLDTFPYPGGTTSVDALWMGVPVLTRRGDRFLAHLGESIAINAGQAAWIADDPAHYVEKAVAFASDLAALARSRLALRAKLLETPLFDAPRFARAFGEALRGMWRAKVG